MSRQPFSMVSGCPSIVVDLDLHLPDPPTSDLAMPTMPVLPPIFIPPDIAPPGDCQCLNVSVDATAMVRRFSSIEKPRFTMVLTKSNPSADCCSVSYMLLPRLELDCVPFTVRSTHRISVVDITLPTMDLQLTKPSGSCAISMMLDLRLPCMPFSLVNDMKATMVSSEVPVIRFSGGLTHPGDCRLKFVGNIELGLPPIALDVDIFPHINVEMDCTSELTGTFGISKNLLENHHVGFNMNWNLKIPKFAFKIGKGALNLLPPMPMPTGNFDFALTRVSGCVLSFSCLLAPKTPSIVMDWNGISPGNAGAGKYIYPNSISWDNTNKRWIISMASTCVQV